ncbi:protein LEAD-SENSITIVE 1 [Nymphaea colorata]|nr:protein LEAD-SENSITIVE 1 [Nymphaea colorata]
MGLLSNKVQRSDLQTGDHVYSWRHAYIYAHHGIYTGDGKVIHFTRAADQEVGTGTFLDRILLSSSLSHTRNPCEKCGDLSAASGVIISCLDCFLSGGELYRFEYEVTPAFFIAKARGGTCTLAKSDTPEEVLHRATYLLQNGFGIYHIFKNNCEDFAIYCKTGLLVITNISVGRSGQAASFVAAATAVVSSPLRFLTTSFSGLAVVAGGMYCVSRYVADIGMRRDVEKIPVERLVARP